VISLVEQMHEVRLTWPLAAVRGLAIQKRGGGALPKLLRIPFIHQSRLSRAQISTKVGPLENTRLPAPPCWRTLARTFTPAKGHARSARL